MCYFSKTIHFQYVCGKSQETFDTCNDCNRQLRWREVRDIRAAQHDIILIHHKKVRTVCYAAAAGAGMTIAKFAGKKEQIGGMIGAGLSLLVTGLIAAMDEETTNIFWEKK